MLVSGANSPHLNDTVNMNGRLDPTTSSWMKVGSGHCNTPTFCKCTHKYSSDTSSNVDCWLTLSVELVVFIVHVLTSAFQLVLRI